ncbi:unnamed protein product [Phytomonas sp. EM1]|nr:unnamed protein product [Phytomonas sp. EM1]|eukprot:CCW61859.1 unnamed protein product [Phytomonas sp. isolate EM1]
MTSNQIFLHITGGRTVWVPAHKAAPHENKPVHILTSVTSMELARSFYIYDYPIQVVEDPRQAAVSPNCKTVQDVVVAVNEFRRACHADHDYLFQRRYDAKKPHAAMPTPQPTSSPNPIGQTDLLAQLLQQRQQQHPPSQPQPQPMIPSSLLNTGASIDPGAASLSTSLGGVLGNIGGPSASGGNRYHNRAQAANYMGNYGSKNGMGDNKSMMMMMGVGMPSAQPSSFNPTTMMLGGVAGGSAAHGNYSAANNPGNMFFPNNMLPPVMMMPQGSYGHPNSPNPASANSANRVGPYNGETRREPEPIEIKVKIPEEILRTYTNPSQTLVCATMPGPRMTVWLREHPVPENKKDLKYVFCKGGIVLMLKAQGAEVKDSKPVELFQKQICTHFLIHGYCSRTNCLHEHHSEEQLRRLIAARHVELKAMTKKERHQLIEKILEKEKDGLRAAEEEREARQRQRQGRMPTKPQPGRGRALGEGDDSALAQSHDASPKQLDNLSDDSNDHEERIPPAAGLTKEAKTPDPSGMTPLAGSKKAGLVPSAIGALPPTSGSTKNVTNITSIGVTDSDDEDSSSEISSNSSSSSASSPSRASSESDHDEPEEKTEPKPASKDPEEALTPASLHEAKQMEELGKKPAAIKAEKKKTTAAVGVVVSKEEEKDQPESHTVQKDESEAPTEHSKDEEASAEEPESEVEDEEEQQPAKRGKKSAKAAPKKSVSKKVKPDPKKRERPVATSKKVPAKRARK